MWFLIICVILITAYLYLYGQKEVQGFTQEGFDTFLQACPAGYKSFYESDGNVQCCDGEIIANKCMGTHPCTLNGKGTVELPQCVTLIEADFKKKAKELCPTAMPNYYEDPKTKGCTMGDLNSTLTAPKTTTQPTCVIYRSLEDNATNKNSCANQKEMEGFPCFGKDCTKELVQTSPNTPVRVAIGFADSSGMHRVAYTRASMQRFLDASNPNWRNQGIDLAKNITVAEVAKAYYVDRTMSQADVQV